jgi:two-component system response regulator ChvI
VFLRAFAANLRAAGHDVVCFNDPLAALEEYKIDPAIDAWVLDWDMPQMDGLALLRALRAHGPGAPVLLLTSHGQPIFEEAALDAGAADFIDKTRGPAIILHRIARVLAPRTPADPAAPAAPLRIGALELSPGGRRALWRDQPVPLSRAEFDVVAMLAGHAGEDVDYRRIYDLVRGDGFIAGQGAEGYRANVRAMVKRIRQKFIRIDPDFDELHNYPGFGYRWRQQR